MDTIFRRSTPLIVFFFLYLCRVGITNAAEQSGPQMRTINDQQFFTHGEDTKEKFSANRPSTQLRLQAQPATFCEGTGQDGPRVQVIYAYETGTQGRYSELLDLIHTISNKISQEIDTGAQMTGGRRIIRYVTTPECAVDVVPTTISHAGMEGFWTLLGELQSQGFNKPNRKYLIYADYYYFCGYSTVTVDDRPGLINKNAGLSYGVVGLACFYPFWWDIAEHELLHGLGAVQHSAPNSTPGFHCVDEWDVMCYNDNPSNPGIVMRIDCPDKDLWYALPDCNHDDYFNISPQAGSYLSTHWNVADSVFLDDPTRETKLVFENGIVRQDGREKFFLSGFALNELVSLRLRDREIRQVTTDPAGAWQGSINIPKHAILGKSIVEARGTHGSFAENTLQVQKKRNNP